MLGGVSPVIIFTFPSDIGASIDRILGGIPVIGNPLGTDEGIPIPIYLDENFTGVYVESESKAMDMNTDITPVYRSDVNKTTTSLINQSGISNIVTINMLALRDSTALAVLLSLNDVVFSKYLAGKYRLSYLNGTTVVFGGLLHSFSIQSNPNDTLSRIQIQIQKANENKPVNGAVYVDRPAQGPSLTPGGG